MCKHLYHTFVCLVAFCALSACTSTTPLPAKRYFWPQPPDQPRLEWLTAYHSRSDLEKSDFLRFKEAIIGEADELALLKPIDVRSDSLNNKIYIADIGAYGVFVFDLARQDLRMLSTRNTNLPETILPLGLALDRAGNLYVLEPRLRQVLVFDHEERFARAIKLEKHFKRPISLAIDKSRSRLYVTDSQLNQVIAIDLNKGDPLFSISGSGDAVGGFNRPVSVAISSSGEIIVADAFNANIKIFDENGVFRRAFGKRGTGAGDFQLIKSVAVDSDDNIYVVDGRSHNVKIFNKTGELLLTFGDFYSVSNSGKLAPGGFAVPIGIDIDNNNKVFVIDQINARVQIFQYISDNAGKSSYVPERPAK